ncbi:MAG: hypothetical protein P4L11_00455 [Geothrix sp.]|nr:hypothetical protein [Geothrix sp.]
MSLRWWFGLILGAALMAGQPVPSQAQAWVLALDARGGLVGDLKPEEFRVKVDGKDRRVVQVKTPAQTADESQSWVLVFEPIRDMNFRAAAFVAAADFLTKVPEGDRVLIVARGKDSLESLLPGFSARRGLWAEALAKVPAMLPEKLLGTSKETLQGAGFQPMFTDASDGAPGQEALNTLLARFTGGPRGWAMGTIDVKGVSVLDRLNLDQQQYVMGLVATVKRESKVLASILDQVAPVSGQKHVIVFSRCESDDLSHPDVRKAMLQTFKRVEGDAGGPAETATLATREVLQLQAEIKRRAVLAGVTLFSVAGAGQTVVGHIGAIAPATGGFAFPFNSGMETQFGRSIQVFGSRYLVQWSEEVTPMASSSLEISTSRKDMRVIARTLR